MHITIWKCPPPPSEYTMVTLLKHHFDPVCDETLHIIFIFYTLTEKKKQTSGIENCAALLDKNTTRRPPWRNEIIFSFRRDTSREIEEERTAVAFNVSWRVSRGKNYSFSIWQVCLSIRLRNKYYCKHQKANMRNRNAAIYYITLLINVWYFCIIIVWILSCKVVMLVESKFPQFHVDNKLSIN